MGTILWQLPEIAEKVFDILERRIAVEPLISVRCCVMRPLVPLFNLDKFRCAQLVERLVQPISESGLAVSDYSEPSKRSRIFGTLKSISSLLMSKIQVLNKLVGGRREKPHICLSPLITNQGTHLLPYLIHQVPEIGWRLIDLLLGSGDEAMQRVGAWHVFGQCFQHPKYIAKADRLIRKGEGYRLLAAEVASQVITREEDIDRTKQQLISFFDDEDKRVRRQAGEAFRSIEPSEFGKFYDLAERYLNSRAFKDDSFAFFHALEQATCKVHELVIIAAEKKIADLDANLTTSEVHYLDLDILNKLLEREYTASENDPDLRHRILDVIDKMLEKELYGTEKILKSHERE